MTGSRPRTILVTGSGSGIGAAIVSRLAKPGTALIIHAKQNKNGCERVLADVCGLGAKAELMLADLSDAHAAHNLVETTADTFGGLDVLIANAGFPVAKSFEELERPDLDACYNVMMGGFFHLSTAALPYLERTEHGRIVAVSVGPVQMFARRKSNMMESVRKWI